MTFRFYLILFLLLRICQSASAQKIFIPYRQGKLWGLADTLGHVVVQPAYDEMETVTFQANFGRRGEIPAAFFVKKAGKYGYIQGTRIIMPVTHGKLYCVDSLFIVDGHQIDSSPTVGSSRDVIYNLRGEQLYADSVNSIEAVRHSTDKNALYAIMAPHNKSALIWFNPLSQQIEQTIISNVKWVNTGGWYDKERLYLFIYKGDSDTPVKYDLTFNAQSHRYSVGTPMANREEPKLTMDDGSGGGYRPIKNNYVLRNFNFNIAGDQVNITMETRRNHERKAIVNNLSYKLNGSSAELKPFASWYSTKPYNDFETEKVDTIFEYRNYVLIRKNKKSGILCGSTVIKPIYDSIADVRHIGYNIPYFVVAKRSAADHLLKWGIINANNKVIIPCVYDQLIGKNGLLWIIRKNNRYGIINSATGKIRLPALYDRVIPTNEYAWSFRVIQNGKYGFVDDRVVGKPIFPFPVDGCIYFQNYRVFYIKSPDDKFSGYADRKGFAYFKE